MDKTEYLSRVTAHTEVVLEEIQFHIKDMLQSLVGVTANNCITRRELISAVNDYLMCVEDVRHFNIICDESNNPPEVESDATLYLDVYVNIDGFMYHNHSFIKPPLPDGVFAIVESVSLEVITDTFEVEVSTTAIETSCNALGWADTCEEDVLESISSMIMQEIDNEIMLDLLKLSIGNSHMSTPSTTAKQMPTSLAKFY